MASVPVWPVARSGLALHRWGLSSRSRGSAESFWALWGQSNRGRPGFRVACPTEDGRGWGGLQERGRSIGEDMPEGMLPFWA